MKDYIFEAVLDECSNRNIRYISGKFFKDKDTEIKDIDKELTKIGMKLGKQGCILRKNDVNEVKDFIERMSEEDDWPELPIINEAKALGPIKDNTNAPFDLDDKQYVILNVLLFHPEYEKMFITTGIGGSGKSTYLNIIRQLFDDDAASIPLTNLTGFQLAEGVTKRIICSDEIGTGVIDGDSIKQVVSKQRVSVNKKYGAIRQAKFQSRVFYCCNKLPKFDISDSGAIRRIAIYTRNTKIENPIFEYGTKRYSKDELLWFARRALAFDKTLPEVEEIFFNETTLNLMANNSVFLTRANSYDQYVERCKKMNLKAYSQPNWHELRELFGEWAKKRL